MTRAVSPLDASPPPGNGSTVVAGAGAMVVHVALFAIAVFVGAHFARQVVKAPTVTQLVEVEIPPEVVPPAEASPAPIRTPIQHSVKPPPAAAPAAAQAGQVLTAADEVVDFGERFVEGKGPGYAGGVTEANGSSAHAVRDLGARGGGAAPVASAVLDVDHSRPAQLAGGATWDCPFPLEADDAGVDHAVVTLRVEVAADGHVLSVTPTGDPGHGFAREARRHALSKRWSAALDRAGTPINSTTVVNVRFNR